MKSKDLEKLLSAAGYVLVRSNAHKVWSNGANQVTTPHQRDVNRMLAKRILKQINYGGCVPELKIG